jgi:hypothetical protein
LGPGQSAAAAQTSRLRSWNHNSKSVLRWRFRTSPSAFSAAPGSPPLHGCGQGVEVNAERLQSIEHGLEHAFDRRGRPAPRSRLVMPPLRGQAIFATHAAKAHFTAGRTAPRKLAPLAADLRRPGQADETATACRAGRLQFVELGEPAGPGGHLVRPDNFVFLATVSKKARRFRFPVFNARGARGRVLPRSMTGHDGDSV